MKIRNHKMMVTVGVVLTCVRQSAVDTAPAVQLETMVVAAEQHAHNFADTLGALPPFRSAVFATIREP